MESDAAFYQNIEDAVRLLVQNGLSEDDALADVVNRVSKSIDPVVDSVHAELMRKQPRLMRQERRLLKIIYADLYAQWRPAFDAFYVAAYSIAEAADALPPSISRQQTVRATMFSRFLQGYTNEGAVSRGRSIICSWAVSRSEHLRGSALCMSWQ